MNIRISYIIILFTVLFIEGIATVSGQKISASIDKNQMYIGEQLQVTLMVQQGQPGTAWFVLPDSISHIEIVDEGKIDTIASQDGIVYRQLIKITSWDSGQWVFPDLGIAGSSQRTLPITINVLPVDVSQLQDYHDIKEIEEVNLKNNWIIVAIIAIVTVIALVLLFIILKRKKRIPVTSSIERVHNPLEWALSEINRLPEKPEGAAAAKKFYSDLSTISRTFFQLQLQQKTMEATTDEWMVSLQDLAIGNEIKTAFYQFLRLADTVKFAKHHPPVADAQTSVAAVKLMLNKAALLPSNIHAKYQPR